MFAFADLDALEAGRVGDAQLNTELAAVLAQERTRRVRVLRERRARRLAKKSKSTEDHEQEQEQDEASKSKTFTEKLAAE